MRTKVFVGIVGALLGLVLLAWVGQWMHVRIVSQGIELRQQREVNTAKQIVQSEFTRTQERMEALVSEAAGLITEYSFPFEQVPSPALIEDLAEIVISEQQSISVYDTDMKLLAWKGQSAPHSLIPEQAYRHWGIARDHEWRTALVLREPIMVEDAVVGSIHVTQNLFSRAPVRNSILEHYDIVDTWEIRTGMDIQVEYGDTVGENFLWSLDGESVGTYEIIPPTKAKLIMGTAEFYGNMMALNAALLVLWILWGMWKWYGTKLNFFGLVIFSVALGAGRFALLYLEVPARYQTGNALLSPLFDPVHLASTFGGGLMSTTGDFLISALCVFILGAAALRYTNAYSKPVSQYRVIAWIRLVAIILLGLILASVLMAAVQASVLDSTLSYTGRSVLIPNLLELIVYGSVLLLTLGIILIISTGFSIGFAMKPGRLGQGILGGVTAVAIILLHWLQWCPWIFSISLMIVCLYIGLCEAKGDIHAWLTVRRVIPTALALCILLYPGYHEALHKRMQSRITHAVTTFDRAVLPNASLAVREIVEKALRQTQLHENLQSGEKIEDEAERLLSGSLFSSLGAYDVGITFLSEGGEEIYSTGDATSSSEDIQDLLVKLSRETELQATDYMFLEPNSAESTRYQYTGLAALGDGWILVQAQPHIISEEANTPLLRILLSSGHLDLYEDLSLASYSDGQLMRTFGKRFAKYRLDPDVASELEQRQSFWREESAGIGRGYLSHYHRRESDIVAVRMAIDGPFDHLYYLLRFVTGGLLLGIPFFMVGYIKQWRSGLIPRTRLRYQDRVMKAFLLLGVVAVIPVGIAGYNVVAGENERAIQSWLRQHLERVESTLIPEGGLGENSVAALERNHIDSLSARVGLDLNLYRGTRLIASSRQQLIDDRIVDQRLPAEVFSAIHGNAEQFTFVDHKLGDFEYTAGYHAILDTSGMPAYILSVPNLPEAERIEEERARTLAYLFGALLGLGILVMFTGSLLARALAQPIARLQKGLENAAQGKFEQVLPVESRDELGALVKTFNTMQSQLAESRQILATQQRQLAWREMARQIAHEIKNPLTPMKLSIQHLQHSFDSKGKNGSKFKKLFHRTTASLIAQVDSLAHIANEFSSFARLPRRQVDNFDLCTVIGEAHELMQASAEVTLNLQLPDSPLPVWGDPGELCRTYINLIKNALEAVRGQEEKTITVTARRDGNRVISQVIDNGKGIPPEMQDRIFEPNFSTKTSGSGLGLAIAKQTVEISGGQISYTTGSDQGTTMRIELPLYQK
ncbi:MAG: ATP-binding protein [Bacteroidetes bacterium]|nr:ATP-binding protein [Bacteroidota bacterium]